MNNKILFIALLLGFSWSNSQAQKTDQPLFSFVSLSSGDVYLGTVSGQNDTSILFNDIYLGEVRVATHQIRERTDVPSMVRVQIMLGNGTKYTGKFMELDSVWMCTFSPETGRPFSFRLNQLSTVDFVIKEGITHGNPNATRYFFAPSAIPLKKRSGYYQNAYLLSNSANFGLTDNFTLGGGVIIPLLFYATPKVGFEVRKNLYVGAGFIAATTIIPDNIVSGGIPFGLITYGTHEANLTLGSGYGVVWVEGEYDHTKNPITTINGMLRLNNRLQLVSENWIIPYDQTDERLVRDGYFDPTTQMYVDPVYEEVVVSEVFMALSLGMRIHINPRSTIDFAPVYLSGGDDLVIPYLDYVYKF